MNPPQNTQQTTANPSTSDMRRAYDALGIPCPTTGAPPAPTTGNLLSAQPRSGLKLPMPGGAGPAIPNLTGGVRVLAPPPQQNQPAPNVSLPLGSGGEPAGAVAANGTAGPAGGLQQQGISNVQLFGLAGNGDGPTPAGLVSKL